MPFDKLPYPNVLNNNKSALDNSEFVASEIQQLLRSGSVIEVKDKHLVVNPLTVTQNSQKKRLALDLRFINPFLWKEKIKFEDWKFALNYYNKDCYLYNFSRI